MRKSIIPVVTASIVLSISAATVADTNVVERNGSMPVATYSIVARDAATGQLGVAVQSHWFSVGPIVPWAEAGVGAVATQSFARIEYGPEGLELMRNGIGAPAALDSLVSLDSLRATRQVAMIDASGNVAAHTGERCIAHAGHIVGDGFSVQANLMADSVVPQVMASAYLNSPADLAGRLMAALSAAQRAGGDIRGKQSAAILIVAGDRQDAPWKGRLVDLRVEDHLTPLVELKRLLTLHESYASMNRGDEYLAAGDIDSAAHYYMQAQGSAHRQMELLFWPAVTLAAEGRTGEAFVMFSRLFRREPVWMELIPRLVDARLLPDNPALIDSILAQGKPRRYDKQEYRDYRDE